MLLMMWPRESPASLGPSPTGRPVLLAMTKRSRRPATALPM